MDFQQRLADGLEALRAKGCLRALPALPRGLVNLSSNDYLGLLEDAALREAFYAGLSGEDRLLSAASSRLLTGNTAAAEALERDLAAAYGAEAALVFGSGYHANTGILPA
ncbi:aminotransferase class I/II-fold pyridoxal phosphate-dependent enzyme, partial [Parabacteroides distasonis]